MLEAPQANSANRVVAPLHRVPCLRTLALTLRVALPLAEINPGAPAKIAVQRQAPQVSAALQSTLARVQPAGQLALSSAYYRLPK